MNTEEQEILTFLKSWTGDFFSAKEIGRRVGGKRKYRDSPNWAKPWLSNLVKRRLVEVDPAGHYRLIPEDEKKKRRRFLAPHIQKALQKSGKDFGESVVIDGADD